VEQGLQTDSILGGPKVTGSDPKEEIAASSLSMFIFAFFFFFFLCYNFCILQINGGKEKQCLSTGDKRGRNLTSEGPH
jgi:hypothetical protein